MRYLRSVAAVLAGLVVFSILLFTMSAGGDAVMFRTYPDLPTTASVVTLNTMTRVLWLAWVTASMVVAGYVTARAAARFETRHATIMAVIEAAMTVVAMLTIQSEDPLWFWLVGIVLMVLAGWFGGTLEAGRSRGGSKDSPLRVDSSARAPSV
jgi:hypothetical protein